MKKILAVLGLLCLPGPSPAEEPARVLVAYFSATGHTKAMAEAVAEGARGVDGVTVELAAIADVETADLLAADAIIVGSPVLNANVAPPVQSFINGWPFRGGPLRDKIGAAFATGGGFSAGEEAVQLGLLRSMLAFGMIVAGGPHWTSAFGAAAVTEEEPFAGGLKKGQVAEVFLKKGRGLGRRVAELAVRIRAPRAREQLRSPEGGMR